MTYKTKNNNMGVIVLLLLAAALIAGLSLLKANQDTRKSAYIGRATAQLLPDGSSFAVGDDIPVVVMVNPIDKKVDQVDVRVCVSDKTKISMADPVASVTAEAASGFTEVVEPNWVPGADNCIRAAFVSTGYDNAVFKNTILKVGTFKFKAVASGNITFSLTETDRVGVAAYNPNGLDPKLFVDTIADSHVTITGNSNIGTGPNISFTFRFSGMQDFDVNNKPSCVNNMKVDVVALNSNGVRNTYPNITVNKVAVKDGIPVWKAQLMLSGFSSATSGKDALFVRGPKHLQMKYGVNNQSQYYNEALGQLTLSNGASFDFTGYPLLGGDVVGATESPDGDINGIDFSYVKAESLKGVSGNVRADLDYNCILNSNDLNILKASLNEKQSQKY